MRSTSAFVQGASNDAPTSARCRYCDGRPFAFYFCLLAFKALYLALLSLFLLNAGDLDESTFHSVNAQWPREGPPVFPSHFATWDAAHYLRLSELGYAAAGDSCAFYPLWPLVVRYLSPGFNGSHVLTGVVIANSLSAYAWLLFYKVIRRQYGQTIAIRALLLLVAYPGALFFQFNYTESLFFLLTMLLWDGLARGEYWRVIVAAFLLPITRAVGVFALLPIVWHALETVGFPWAGIHNMATSVRPAYRNRSAIWALPIIPVLGWTCYLALMWSWTGNPFQGFVAQRHWGVHSIGNLVNVPKFALALASPTDWHAFTGSLLDRIVFICVAWTIPVLWRVDRRLLIWIYWLGVLPAMSGMFTSYMRFASCAFPAFIALAASTSGLGGGPQVGEQELRHDSIWNWRFGGLVIIMAAIHALMVWRFVNFRWAG